MAKKKRAPKNRIAENGTQPDVMDVSLTDRQVQMIQQLFAERQQVLAQYDARIAQVVDSMVAGHDIEFERVRNKTLDLEQKKVTLTLA